MVEFNLVQPQDAGLCSGVGADSAQIFRMASAATGKRDHVFASQIEVTTGMRFAAAFDQFFIKRNSIFLWRFWPLEIACPSLRSPAICHMTAASVRTDIRSAT